MTDSSGAVLPLIGDRRSSADFGRAVMAAALDGADPVGAAAVRRDKDWRRGYITHASRLVEAALLSPDQAHSIARAGLESISGSMRFIRDGVESGLAEVIHAAPIQQLHTVVVAAGTEPIAELAVPFEGKQLRGADLAQQLQDWVRSGSMEPSAAAAIGEVAAHPQWLSLPGRTVAVLGATSEMGPLRLLLQWGVQVAAVDLPRPQVWHEILSRPRAGQLLVPSRDPAPPSTEQSAGADLMHDPAAVAQWLESLPGDLVIGNYVYADGVDNLRLSASVDALAVRILASRPQTALAFLATPTDVFAVPSEVVEFSTEAYERQSLLRTMRPLARLASGGRLLRRNYAAGADPGINDSVVAQQGPNYILAKRIHRWRATEAASNGQLVSMNVAPPTRTRSVLKNRALAAAYSGAHRFGVEVFDPSTSAVLMAALLVHDLCANAAPATVPWQQEARNAIHGGLWRGPYAPRSALGIAVVLGVGGLRA